MSDSSLLMRASHMSSISCGRAFSAEKLPTMPASFGASAGKPETNANNTWLLGLEAWQWMFLIMLVPALIYGLLALMIASLAIGPAGLSARTALEALWSGAGVAGVIVRDVPVIPAEWLRWISRLPAEGGPSGQEWAARAQRLLGEAFERAGL